MGRLQIKVVAITEARENDNVLCAATARPVLPGLDPCMAAENVLGNAIRCTERLQSDKQGTATANRDQGGADRPTTKQSWERGIGQANQRLQHKKREGAAEAAKRGQRGEEQ